MVDKVVPDNLPAAESARKPAAESTLVRAERYTETMRESCWCGTRDTETHWTGAYRRGSKIERAELLRCTACDTVRSGVQLRVTGQRGDGPGGKFLSQESMAWERRNATLVARHAQRGPLLDVGANSGYLLELLAARGFAPAVGLEPNDEAAAAAHRRNLNVRVGWFTSEATPDGPFTTITMSHVLEHVPDPVAALELAADRLAPGGRLFVFVPNIASWPARRRTSRWFALNPVDHVWHFEPDTLRRLTASIGSLRVAITTTTGLSSLQWHTPRRCHTSIMTWINRCRGRGEQVCLVADRVE